MDGAPDPDLTATDAATAIKAKVENLLAICEAESPSIVALQEAPPSALKALETAQYEVRFATTPYLKDVVLVTGFRSPATWVLDGTEHVSARSRLLLTPLIHSASTVSVDVWNVHARSQALGGIAETIEHLTLVSRALQDRRRDRVGAGLHLCHEILTGDLNCPPYEREVVTKNSEIYGYWCEHPVAPSSVFQFAFPLYNYAWKIFGHVRPPHGTYYHRQHGGWSVFDQTLVSLPIAIPTEPPKIVTTSKLGSLLKPDLTPNRSISDHLPVLVRVAV